MKITYPIMKSVVHTHERVDGKKFKQIVQLAKRQKKQGLILDWSLETEDFEQPVLRERKGYNTFHDVPTSGLFKTVKITYVISMEDGVPVV